MIGLNTLVTGAAGFIGSHFVNLLMESMPGTANVVVLDSLEYCARMDNLSDDTKERIIFTHGNICDSELVLGILEKYQIQTVVHFAAETNVDNSFANSLKFTMTNVYGTHVLLEACRWHMKSIGVYSPENPIGFHRFVHISTDEVYGEASLDQEKGFCEKALLNPTNPYAATKAGAEFLVRSYYHSYKLPVIITRGNNVYGPHQYPEKIIPKFSMLLLENKKMTVQGKGISRRNFIHVQDTARAVLCILDRGIVGEIYNIGSNKHEYSVLEVAEMLRGIICPSKTLDEVITYVPDRDFNDIRYFLKTEKLEALGWREEIDFQEGLRETVEWYREHGHTFQEKPE